MSADLAGGVLQLVVRALPERQAEWGDAMRAELVGIAGRGERRQFAVGCVLAVLRRPAGVLAVGRWLVCAALLVAAVALGWGIGVPRIRAEALGVVAGLVLGHRLLRSRIGFGPVAAARGARLLAAGGILAVGAEAMLEFRRLRVDPPLTLPMNATTGIYDESRATWNLVALAVVLGVLLVALTGVTSGRFAVRPSTIVVGAGTAAAAATIWLAVVLFHPAASTGAGPALLGVLAAGLVASAWAGDSSWASGDSSWASGQPVARVDAHQALVAGLLAAAGTTTALGLLMDLLPLTGHWVANDAPPASTAPPPTRLVDTVVVWLPGLLFTLGLILTLRRPSQAPHSTGAAGRTAFAQPAPINHSADSHQPLSGLSSRAHARDGSFTAWPPAGVPKASAVAVPTHHRRPRW